MYFRDICVQCAGKPSTPQKLSVVRTGCCCTLHRDHTLFTFLPLPVKLLPLMLPPLFIHAVMSALQMKAFRRPLLTHRIKTHMTNAIITLKSTTVDAISFLVSGPSSPCTHASPTWCLWDWRDGSVVKGTCVSYPSLATGAQVTVPMTQALWESMPLVFAGTVTQNMHILHTNIYLIKTK